MITLDQVHILSKKYHISDMVIFREYIQLLFLQKLSQETKSQKIFFKGGTAVHLIYKAPRFSEDLNFTVELTPLEFSSCIKKVLDRMTQEEGVTWKPKKSITGQSTLLTVPPGTLTNPTFINLDFSFREKVLSPTRSIITTEYPLVFTSYLYHLSGEEILAEKIRAIMTRKKGRDLYDLWYLFSTQTSLNSTLVKEKLTYYNMDTTDVQKHILERIEAFGEKEFILDLRPFVPEQERGKLGEFFRYLKEQIEMSLDNERIA